MVTRSILVDVGFGGGALSEVANRDEKKGSRVLVSHGWIGWITVGGGIGEPADIVTVKFEIVTVRVNTIVSVKGLSVTTPEQLGTIVLMPVPSKNPPECRENCSPGNPKDGRTS